MALQYRIEELIRYSGKNISEFSRFVGFKTPQAVRELLKGNTRTLSEAARLKIISAFPQVNEDWLLSGEGDMLKSAGIESEIIPTAKDNEENIPKRYITYEVPMAAMGGSLIGFDGEGVRKEDCERIVSPIADVDWAVPVCGDSMEPEYPNGSKVFVRQINPRDFIAWGNVFVLDTTNGLIIKMVVESDKKDCVRCVSLNPSQRYAPFDVPMRSIRAMYRVLACVAIK